MSNYFQSREWMDHRIDSENNCVSSEFIEGINVFIQFACNQACYLERNTLLCPCARCKNTKQREAKVVSRHLFMYGFKGNYYIWTSHGENYFDVGESSGANNVNDEDGMCEGQHTHVSGAHHYVQEGNEYMGEEEVPPYVPTNVGEPVNEEPYNDGIFQAFEEANQPLYDGCEDGISQLYVASQMMKAKTDYNLAESCVDELSQMFKKILPQPNKAPASYYETKKLVRGLGLPVHKIDVCEDNCIK